MCVRYVYWIWHGHWILILNNIKRSMLLPRELSFTMYCEFTTDTIPYYSYYLQIVDRFLAFAPSYSISWIKLIDVNQIYEEWGKTIRNHQRTIHKNERFWMLNKKENGSMVLKSKYCQIHRHGDMNHSFPLLNGSKIDSIQISVCLLFFLATNSLHSI